MSNEEIMQEVKKAICAKLKSPASAQFPVDAITITGDDVNGYHIDGFVDSQNSYGAMIRNDFTADVVISNGVPVVTASQVGAKANVQRAKNFGISYLAVSVFVLIGTVIMYMFIKMMVGF